MPSHSGINDNELADHESKKGTAKMHSDQQIKYSFASLQKWQINKYIQERNNWWESNTPSSYSQLEIKTAPPVPKELRLSRKHLGRIIASRTGHGDFASYHTRFKHQNANLYCQCGSRKTPIHFFFCRIMRRRSGRPPGPISSLIPSLLGTPDGAVKLSKWLEKT